MMKLLLTFIFLIGSFMATAHPDFVSLSDVCPELKIQASYSSNQNFTGSVVAGYQAKKAYLAKVPAEALCQVQKVAKARGFTLKIFDGYRPVKAVQFFINWAQRPEDNPGIKEMYYPNYTRLELFQNGYIAKASSHSRGSAVDLTLVDNKTGLDLDMGSGFDYFDHISHTESVEITPLQKKNRMILKNLMESKGFVNYAKEWWHFSFRPEPFPGQAFDFDVK